jgi:hypothetical protein
MHVVAVAAWRQMHTDSLGSPNGDHRIGDFKHEPSAILDRTTVFVRAMIGTVLKKLVDEVTIGPVYLDTVKSSDLSVLCAMTEALDDAWDL